MRAIPAGLAMKLIQRNDDEAEELGFRLRHSSIKDMRRRRSVFGLFLAGCRLHECGCPLSDWNSQACSGTAKSAAGFGRGYRFGHGLFADRNARLRAGDRELCGHPGASSNGFAQPRQATTPDTIWLLPLKSDSMQWWLPNTRSTNGSDIGLSAYCAWWPVLPRLRRCLCLPRKHAARCETCCS